MGDWIGPCACGCDPWDRCDECGEMDESAAMLKRLWAVERWLSTEQAVAGRQQETIASLKAALEKETQRADDLRSESEGMSASIESLLFQTADLKAALATAQGRVKELETLKTSHRYYKSKVEGLQESFDEMYARAQSAEMLHAQARQEADVAVAAARDLAERARAEALEEAAKWMNESGWLDVRFVNGSDVQCPAGDSMLAALLTPNKAPEEKRKSKCRECGAVLEEFKEPNRNVWHSTHYCEAPEEGTK